MRNFLYNINQVGLPVMPVNDAPESPTGKGLIWLSVRAVIISIPVALFVGVMTFLLKWLHEETNFVFYLPLLATTAWILINVLAPVFLRFLGISVGVSAGVPLGIESPAMAFSTAVVRLVGSNVILYRCGITAAIAACFGTPLVAVLFALEILLDEWTIGSLIPVIISAAIGAGFSWMMNGSIPVFNATISRPDIIWSLCIAVGLIGGIWGAITINLTNIFKRWLGALTNKNYWTLLIPGVITSFVYYYMPHQVNNLNGYMENILQAQVTLSLLFSLVMLNWILWILYNAGFKTGTGILPILLNGGAWELFVGLMVQVSVPTLKVDAVLIVLLGMIAMFAATSRALVTALVLVLEITHSWNLVLPGIITGVVAYGLSYLLIRKQRRVTSVPAL